MVEAKAEWGVLEAAWSKLSDEAKGHLALLAQVLTKTGVHATLVVFSSEELANAFDRLWAFADSTGAELHWAQGGRQPIRGLKGLTQSREEELRRKAANS